jgi:abortive infection bacteriophage resistance protein
VAFEVLTFGVIFKLYKNLNNLDKVEIATTYYNLKHYEVANSLHMCSLVRNKCAHYSRIFNQPLSANAFTHASDKEKGISSNTLFAVINNMKYLMLDKSIWVNWVTTLEALLEEYSEVDSAKLGFITEWKKQLRAL